MIAIPNRSLSAWILGGCLAAANCGVLQAQVQDDVPTPPLPGIPALKPPEEKDQKPDAAKSDADKSDRVIPNTEPDEPASLKPPVNEVPPAPAPAPADETPVQPPAPESLEPAPLTAAPQRPCNCGKSGGYQSAMPGPGFGVPGPSIGWGYAEPMPVVGGVHGRYPYYSYRRPWYSPGPVSANVTIIW